MEASNRTQLKAGVGAQVSTCRKPFATSARTTAAMAVAAVAAAAALEAAEGTATAAVQHCCRGAHDSTPVARTVTSAASARRLRKACAESACRGWPSPKT